MAVSGLGNEKNDKLGLVDFSREASCGSTLRMPSARVFNGNRSAKPGCH